MDDIKTILSALKEINDSKTETFKLPVSKHKVSLSPLNAKHTTAIDSSILASSGNGSYGLKFQPLMKTIFSDVLTLPSGVTYKDFGVFDFNYIIMKMRSMLNPIFELDGDSVDVNNNIKKAEVVAKEGFETSGQCGNSKDGVVVGISLPSYHKNMRFDRIIDSATTELSDKEPEKATTEIFIYTLLRFIERASFKMDNEEVVIEFSKLSPKEQRDVIGGFSSSLYRELFESIQKLNEPLQGVLEVEEYDFELPIDQTLLISSK